jgi:hypothetical protein
MHSDRLHRHEQRLRDFAVAHPFGHLRHSSLAGRERLWAAEALAPGPRARGYKLIACATGNR